MLNYAYAVLIAQTQIRLIVEGYDPTIGIMHEKKALRGINPGLALDHMEPMRPVVDRSVLQLIDTVTFTGADFSIQHDGVCRMNPELARRVAQLALECCEVGGNGSQIPRRSGVNSPSSPRHALNTATCLRHSVCVGRA